MVDPGKAITVGAQIITIAQKQGWLKRVQTTLRKKHYVLVLGASGTGKTNFINSLTELAPEAIDRISRTASVVNHHVLIEGIPFIFIDTPGQQQHSSRRREGVQEASRKRAEGIINVVSYGYHEATASVREVVTPEKTPQSAFLEERRNEEIRSLNEWVSVISTVGDVSWLMTVVSKADLWWNDQETVLNHYNSDSYAKAIEVTGLPS